MKIRLKREALERLPLFPLPDVVLFPHSMVPLLMFEPRYRRMAADVIAGHSMIGILLDLQDERHKSASRSVICIGRVLMHQKLRDGRYQLMVHGVTRGRVMEELETPSPYRVGRVMPIPDILPTDRRELLVTLAVLRSLLEPLTRTKPQLARVVKEIITASSDPSVVSDALVTILLHQPRARQKMLETPQVVSRLGAVVNELTREISDAPSRLLESAILN